MTARPALYAACIATLALAACREPVEPRRAVPAISVDESADDGDSPNILTIDHEVPHVSTLPANMGESVGLFVRERVRDGGDKPREAVLMIGGRSVPVLPGMALQYADYDWALWLARSGGFDVFTLDFQGAGRSPRPKMDDPCNVPMAQQAILIPNPLAATCAHSYASTLNTTASDLAELDAVVDYVRRKRGVEKVHLVAWSQGSFRIGPYAVQHPDKVASLLFLAPIFNTKFVRTPPVADPSPMTLSTRADLFAGNGVSTGWDPEVRCEGQREPGIEEVVWASIMENDALGRTWGPAPAGAPEGSPSEGVMRVRQAILSGWNADLASRIEVPTLIIRGELDSGQGGLQQVAELYGLVQNENKLRFTVQCTGHYMAWESERWILHQVSKEWIKHGRVGGFAQGEFRIDTQGNLTPEPAP